MNRLTILITALLVAMVTQAGVVTIDEARQKAQLFIDTQMAGSRSCDTRTNQAQTSLRQIGNGPDNEYYVFSQDNGEGYIIVSGDDRTADILGYSDSGTFDMQHLPDNMRGWLQNYAEQIHQLDLCGIDRRFTTYAPAVAGRKVIEPLIKARWGQFEPYNDLCPTDPTAGTTCPTGCAATAMAQVLSYHRYPSRTTAVIPAYTTITRKIALSAVNKTNINWSAMLSNYNGVNATPTQTQAVYTLMMLCGRAIHMDYTANWSSADAFHIAHALYQYFGYDAGARNIIRGEMGYNEWDKAIYEEIAAKRPIIFKGSSDSNGNDASHIFVIDGYDGNGYYHANWGWEGGSNGFFLLSVLPPGVSAEDEQLLSNLGYSFWQMAVIGIKPNAGGTAVSPVLTTSSLKLNGNTTVTRQSTSVNFPSVPIIKGTFNYTGDTRRFDMGVGIIDEQGKLVSTQSIVENFELPGNIGWPNYPVDVIFKSNLKNGNYRIVNISRVSNQGWGWQLDIDAIKYCIHAKVDGRTLKLQQATSNLSGQLTLAGTAEAKRLARLKLHVKNNGTVFHDPVFLFIDGQRMGGRYVDVEAGGTADIEIGFTPASKGSHALSMAYIANGQYVHFAKLNVNAAAPAYNKLEMSLGTTNAKSGIIGSKLQFTVKVKNTNTKVFDNKISAYIYKLRHDGSDIGDNVGRCDRYLNIAAGKTATASFTFNDLEDGEHYFVWVYYYSEGVLNSNKFWGGGYDVNIASKVEDVQQKPADEVVDIFTLAGTLAGRCQRSKLKEWLGKMPHGIYIVDGKKIELTE